MAEAPKVLSINVTPKDFIDDVQHLTALEIGVYSMICHYLVTRGQDDEPPSLPDDDTMLASIGKVTVAQWRKIRPRLCDGHMAVLTAVEGRISQARVVEEIEAARVRILAGQTGGKASGEARRRKKVLLEERMRNDRSTIVQSPREKQSNESRTSHESRVTKRRVSIETLPTAADATLRERLADSGIKIGKAQAKVIGEICESPGAEHALAVFAAQRQRILAADHPLGYFVALLAGAKPMKLAIAKPYVEPDVGVTAQDIYDLEHALRCEEWSRIDCQREEASAYVQFIRDEYGNRDDCGSRGNLSGAPTLEAWLSRRGVA